MVYPLSPLVKYMLQVVLLTLIYFVAGKIGIQFANTAGNVSLIWPPTGIALALIIRLGYRYWPVIVLGAILLNITSDIPLHTAAMITAGNALEALGAAALLRRFGFKPSFDNVYHVLRFVGLAVLVATTFSATFGTVALCLTGIQQWENFGAVWGLWWLGDVMSALVLTPVLLLWSGGQNHLASRRMVEFLLFLAVLTVVSLVIFAAPLVTSEIYPVTYIAFGFVLWASLRFNQREVAASSLVISIIAVAGTTRGVGPFIGVDLYHSLIYLWGYIGTVTIIALLLSAALAEREHAQAELRDSEARFRAIFNGAIVGIAVIDYPGHPIQMNDTLLEMFGYTEQEMRALTFRQITHPDDIDISERSVQRLMVGEATHYALEKRYFRKNGELMWAQIHISLFPGQAGGKKLRIAIIEDISERKRAEFALHELNAQLEDRVAERTAELSAANERLTELDRLKSKFIADVSHELRTPLTILNTRVYLLERSRPEQWKEYLGNLRDQIERLTLFVNTILDLSRLELGEGKVKFGAVDLNQVVGQVSHALAPRAEMSGLRLNVEYQPDLPPVRGEFNQLAQVATNLIANAINYTPNGGVEVCTSTSSGGVCLQVRDTGMGITPDDLPHLFERFYRGEKAGQTSLPGSGLGLSIVKEIIDLHNGKIEIESTVGQGSTFTVWLPAWSENGH